MDICFSLPGCSLYLSLKMSSKLNFGPSCISLHFFCHLFLVVVCIEHKGTIAITSLCLPGAPNKETHPRARLWCLRRASWHGTEPHRVTQGDSWKEKASLAKQGQGAWVMWWRKRYTAVHEEGDEADGLVVISLLKHPWDKDKQLIQNLPTPIHTTMKILLLTSLS